jgi:GH3 auxin-responsive promoter
MVYRLFLETDGTALVNASTLAAMIDEKLGELNIEYQAKRDSGRLAPLAVVWLKHGTSEAYKAACVRLGQREGQFKPTVLLYRQNLNLPLADYAAS